MCSTKNQQNIDKLLWFILNDSKVTYEASSQRVLSLLSYVMVPEAKMQEIYGFWWPAKLERPSTLFKNSVKRNLILQHCSASIPFLYNNRKLHKSKRMSYKRKQLVKQQLAKKLRRFLTKKYSMSLTQKTTTNYIYPKFFINHVRSVKKMAAVFNLNKQATILYKSTSPTNLDPLCNYTKTRSALVNVQRLAHLRNFRFFGARQLNDNTMMRTYRNLKVRGVIGPYYHVFKKNLLRSYKGIVPFLHCGIRTLFEFNRLWWTRRIIIRFTKGWFSSKDLNRSVKSLPLPRHRKHAYKLLNTFLLRQFKFFSN